MKQSKSTSYHPFVIYRRKTLDTHRHRQKPTHRHTDTLVELSCHELKHEINHKGKLVNDIKEAMGDFFSAS